MTPQEKAKQLVDKFSNECLLTTEGGKVAALIAVDEIIKQFVGVYDSLKDAGVLDSASIQDSANYKYWQEVKQEIEKL